MKKVALVFALAVFVPSLVLAWLAVRSLRDQQFLLERQQSLLYQGVADSVAKEVLDALQEHQRVFTAKVNGLLQDRTPMELAKSFDDLLRRDWPLAQVGFVVTLAGDLLAPSPSSRPDARTFFADNSRFLANRESVEVYLNANPVANNASAGAQLQSRLSPQTEAKLDTNQRYDRAKEPATRNVIPQQALSSLKKGPAPELAQQSLSKVAASEAEFRQLIGQEDAGMLARFEIGRAHV